MAGGLYSAGKVAVDVVPDTTGFWTLLHADLSSRRPEVTVDVNMRGVAQAEGALSRLDGRTLTNVVRIEGDDSGLRHIDRMIRQQRLLWEKRPITSKYDLDDTPFISKITNLAALARTSTEHVNSFVKQSGKSVTETLRGNITDLRKKQSEYDRKVEDATRRREKLVKDEKAAYDMYSESISANRSKIEHLTKSIDDANRVLEWSKQRMKELRTEGDKAGADWFKNTRIPELREQIKGFTAQIREAKKEIRDYKKEQDKLYTADFDNRVAELTRKIEDGTRKWEESVDAIREYSSQLKDPKLLQDEFTQSTDRMTSMFRKSLDVQKQADMLARQQAQTLPRLTEGQNLLADVLGDVNGRYTDLDGNMSDSKRDMDRQRQTARDLTDVFDEQGNAVRDLMQAFERFKPMGIDRLTGQQLNRTIKQLDALKEYAVRHPIEAKLRMDKGDWDHSYTDVMFKAEKLRAKLEQDHEVDVRVKVWEDSADRLEKRLNKLRHTRLDIPVDWQVEQESLITAMRETAAKIKADPSRRWELEADLDVQMHRAEERLKRFEDDHDELRMDLDLETALASAHLAYFTRPRTVDVFANFKGTDAGKIIQGMVSGATGLKGVENQFRKLVNLFDSLDETVPKWSLLGAVVTALGAGLLNLGRTAGGVGVSIVSMSKAALAAPAALVGLGAAGYVAYAAYSQLGDQFDVTKTKLNGLRADVGNAFWDESLASVNGLADSLDERMRPALVEVARSEGQVVAGLADIVKTSNASGELPNIFDNTNSAVQRLNPGLQSLLKASLSLGDQTSEYLPRMADYLSEVADGWANWVDTASRTGQIDAAMGKAIEQGGYLKSSVGGLIGVFQGLFRPLAETQNGLETFSENVRNADKAVNSVRFQETLTALAQGAKDAQNGVRDSFSQAGDAAYTLRDEFKQVFGDAGATVGSSVAGISRMLQQAGPGISRFSAGVREGFEETFDAVGDAGPMFSDLLGMVGDLSSTFGGTFASSLKSAAPLISAIAKGASTVSDLFSKLPGPVQSAIALWLTFGRAGVQSFNSVKIGMLQNIQQTMQYRRMLGELGLSADKASVSIGTLVTAMGRLRSSEYAGALSNAVHQVDSVGDAAERNTKKLEAAAESSEQYSASTTRIVSSSDNAKDAMRKVGDEAEKTPKRFSGLKTAATGLLDAFGGPWALAATAAFTTVGMAVDSYTRHTQGAKAATDDLKQSMVGLKNTAANTDSGVREVQKAFDNTDVGHGGFTGWVNGLQTGFSSAAQNAKALGISQEELTKGVTGSKEEYQALIDKLNNFNDIIDPTTGQLNAQGHAVIDLIKQVQELHTSYGAAGDEMQKYMASTQMVTDLQGKASDTLTRFAQSFAANGGSLDQATEGGRRNVQMLDDIVSSTKNAVEQTLAYGRANGTMGQAVQDATNLMYNARQSVVQTMTSFGMSQEAAEAYADSLGLIPSDVNTKITADTTMSRQQVEQYVSQLKLTEGQREMVLKLQSQGAITSVESLQHVVDGVVNGDYRLVMTADGKQVYMTAEQVRLFAEKNADGTYTTKLTAEDMASGTVEGLQHRLQALGTFSQQDIRILLSGDANAIGKIQNLSGKLRGILSQKDIELIVNTQDNSSGKLDGIRDKLREIGLNDSQIDILLNAIDNASGPIKSVQAETIDGKTVELTANDQATGFVNALNALGLDPKSTDLSANDLATAVIQYVNSQGLSDKWTRLNAQDLASNIIGWVNSLGLGDKYTRLNAQDLASSIIAQVQAEQIADKSFNVIAHYVVDQSQGARPMGGQVSSAFATGGRILGPGTGMSDSIPAMLSNGEMVIRATSVRKLDAEYGQSFLNGLNAYGNVEKAMRPSSFALNARRRTQAYASGGRVGARVSDWNIQVNPVVNVDIPSNRGGNRTFNQNVTINNASDAQLVTAKVMARTRQLISGEY